MSNYEEIKEEIYKLSFLETVLVKELIKRLYFRRLFPQKADRIIGAIQYLSFKLN